MKYILGLVMSFFILINGFSQQKIDTIKTGIYLKSLYDFNSSSFSYDVDLWMWFSYKIDSLNPLKTIEIANEKNMNIQIKASKKEVI